MTKRDFRKFKRNERDLYATPPEPVLKLLPHLAGARTFAEPMCGDGAMVRTLEENELQCRFMLDLNPHGDMAFRAREGNALDSTEGDYEGCDLIVTNPPWPRPMANGAPTVQIIRRLMRFKPSWFLLSADFMHNAYFLPLAPFCGKIVSVGRVSWLNNSVGGFDNASWYLFYSDPSQSPNDGIRFWPNQKPAMRGST